MLRAIYADKTGSIYEYKQTKTIEPVYVEQLISDNFFYRDDTIETIAIIRTKGKTLKQCIKI